MSYAPSDIDLLGKSHTFIELATALAKMQNCRVSTTMLYITTHKKGPKAPIAEISNNEFRILNIQKIKEELVGEQALDL